MSLVIAMRCLSGPQVGMGHLMRCREIARYLGDLGHRAVIMGPALSLQTPQDHHLFADWVPEPDVFDAQKDCEAFLTFCAHYGARHAIMDDYRIASVYQRTLQGAGIRTLQQFDASRPCEFWADLIVNAGPAEQREDYAQYLSNTATRTLFGPQYAVLRPEFSTLSARRDGRALRRIFLCFGGGDDAGTLGRVTQALQPALGDQISIVAVSAATNPAAGGYRQRLGTLPGVTYTIDPPNMADLMRSCDAAVLAGGTMSYEAAICGLPLILMAMAPNQRRACQGWAERVGAIFLGDANQVSDTDVVTAVTTLAEDDVRRRDMARKGRQAVDGRGVIRLVDALLDTTNGKDPRP